MARVLLAHTKLISVTASLILISLSAAGLPVSLHSKKLPALRELSRQGRGVRHSCRLKTIRVCSRESKTRCLKPLLKSSSRLFEHGQFVS